MLALSGERGRNRTFNLLIKSHVGSNIKKLTTHNKPVTYKSLARTENSLQVLEKFAIFGNVQPQSQPHFRHSGVDASDDGMSAAFSGLRTTAFSPLFSNNLTLQSGPSFVTIP